MQPPSGTTWLRAHARRQAERVRHVACGLAALFCTYVCLVLLHTQPASIVHASPHHPAVNPAPDLPAPCAPQARTAPIQRLADAVAGKFAYGVMGLSAATFVFWSTVGTRMFPQVRLG